METRPYRMKARADRQAATRRRIVEAAVELHTTLGPARTSISAIAERAGVQRHTVYAHFPDEPALFGACSGHWSDLHPFPDPERWQSIEDPKLRLRRALRDVYGWYAEVEADLALIRRDEHLYPSLRDERESLMRSLTASLAGPLGRRRLVKAAVGHALEFETWRSLVRGQGLSSAEAVDAMVALVASA
jgi:AcrR family transcriptional regulator